MANLHHALPRIGAAFRFDIASEIEAHLDRFDVLEFMIEHYIRSGGYGRRRAEAVAASVATVAHGIRMSLGSAELPDAAYVGAVGAALDRLGALHFSEHLAFTRAGGIEVDELISLPLNDETLETMVRNVRFVQSRIGCPLLIENVPTSLKYDDSRLSEVEFLNALRRETGVGILLDVENAYANDVNGGSKVHDLVNGLALGSVKAIHLAGGEWRNGSYVDTHAQDIPLPVLEHCAIACELHRPNEIIVERDANYSGADTLVSEVGRVRACLRSMVEV